MSPTVARAQIVALKQRIPFLYAILVVNTAAYAFIHFGTAPVIYVLVLPALMVAGLSARAAHWARMDVAALDDAAVAMVRQRLLLFAGIIGVMLMVWALAMHWAEVGAWNMTDVRVGDLEFYICLSSIACICLLMHLPVAAITLTALVLVPFALLLFAIGGVAEAATAANLLLAGAAMTYVAIDFGRDFTRMVTSTEELLHLSQVNAELAASDALTGLPNRRSFFGDLEHISKLSDVFAVVLVDLDGFKHVNDVYGHKAGDRVLTAVVRRMQAVLPGGALLARLGGDEFGCILRGSEVACADRIAESLIRVCQTPIECREFTASVGASAGLCIGSSSFEPSVSYEQADYALFEAKRTGRGRAVWFTGEHDARMRRASHIAQLLHGPDFHQQLSMAYQPLVNAVTRKVVAFETLVRWEHSVLGSVTPSEFIPVAERSDVIFAISRDVTRKALADAAHWPPEISIKINVSVRDLRSRAQTVALVTELVQSGFQPERVTFEVTETIFAESLGEVCANVALLRDTGCRIAIDDFGTGYSSLNYVHILSPDTIKVDRCFTAEVTRNERSRRVVRTIIELARNVGAITVAEGVETEEQARVLQELGCDTLQGFYFSHPLTSADAIDFVRAQSARAGGWALPALQTELSSAT